MSEVNQEAQTRPQAMVCLDCGYEADNHETTRFVTIQLKCSVYHVCEYCDADWTSRQQQVKGENQQ